MAALPQAVPFGICTRSLGRSGGGHYIPDILDECAKNGLWTIEVAYECLEVGHWLAKACEEHRLTARTRAMPRHSLALPISRTAFAKRLV